MGIGNISNGEAAASVRSKLNQAINGIDNVSSRRAFLASGTAAALAAALGLSVPIIESAFAVTLTGETVIPDNTELQHMQFNGSGTLKLGSNVTLYQCEFDGPIVKVAHDADDTNIVLCHFKNGSYISGLSGSNRGPYKLNVSLCTTENSPLLYATTMNKSVVSACTVNAATYNFAVSFFGSNNEITSVTVNGGLTGICLLPTRSVNKRQAAFNNVISHCEVNDVDEEGISLDCRGDSASNGLSVASAVIATATSDKITFDETFPAYDQLFQYVVWQDGPRKGQMHQITYAGSAGTGPYTLEGYTAEDGDVGSLITVQLGASGNTVQHCKVKDSGLAGIKVWGGFLNTTVFNNEVEGCDIECDSLSGITSTIRLAYQTPHYLTLRDNKAKRGDIYVRRTDYGAETAIQPVGVQVTGNKPAAGHVVDVDWADNPEVSANDHLVIASPIRAAKPGGGKLVLPLVTLTNGVAHTIHTLTLPAKFAASAVVNVTLGLAQCAATKRTDIIAYRSNESTSKFSVNVAGGTLVKDIEAPGNRDISALDVTASLNTSTTFDDTATLDIILTATLTGGLVSGSTTATAFVEIDYQQFTY